MYSPLLDKVAKTVTAWSMKFNACTEVKMIKFIKFTHHSTHTSQKGFFTGQQHLLERYSQFLWHFENPHESQILQCIVSENIHTSPIEKIFSKPLPPPPWENPIYLHTFIEFFPFEAPTPLEYSIPSVGEGGYEHFLYITTQSNSWLQTWSAME